MHGKSPSFCTEACTGSSHLPVLRHAWEVNILLCLGMRVKYTSYLAGNACEQKCFLCLCVPVKFYVLLCSTLHVESRHPCSAMHVKFTSSSYRACMQRFVFTSLCMHAKLTQASSPVCLGMHVQQMSSCGVSTIYVCLCTQVHTLLFLYMQISPPLYMLRRGW